MPKLATLICVPKRNDLTMSEITRAVTAVIRVALAPALRSSGFRGGPLRFHNSANSECVQVVEVQTSRRKTGEFTINLGVWPRPIHELMNWMPRRPVPATHECAIRQRIGSLLSPPRDYWWKLGTEPMRAELANEVLATWIAVGAPFLNSLVNWESARKYILRTDHGFRAFHVFLLDRDFAQAEAIFFRCIAASANHKYAGALRRSGSRTRWLESSLCPSADRHRRGRGLCGSIDRNYALKTSFASAQFGPAFTSTFSGTRSG